MELDSRIKSLSDILTCFDIEKAKQFIGQMGYFAGDLYCFSDIEQLCPYDKLVNVFDQDDAFYRGDITFPFFLPECYLKPAKKKYRPFANSSEFFKKTSFAECDLIHIRSKPNNYEYHLMLIGWSDDDLMLGGLRIMSFDELFQNFELCDDEGNFIPFGVEEK